jgi:hypothetical protein
MILVREDLSEVREVLKKTLDLTCPIPELNHLILQFSQLHLRPSKLHCMGINQMLSTTLSLALVDAVHVSDLGLEQARFL